MSLSYFNKRSLLPVLTFSLHVIPSSVSDRFSFMCTTTFR